MRFTDAHSPSSVCSPTRYSVLTGRYAWRIWLKNWVVQQNHPLLIGIGTDVGVFTVPDELPTEDDA